MAALLALVGSRIFGPLAMVSMPVQLALLYWARRSELSADRASALVMGGSQPVIDAMARLAGGPKSITDQINRDLWARQAEEYDKLMESQWDELLQGLAVMDRSHPFLAVRTREITNWCDSAEFRDLLAGARAPAEGTCPSCGTPLGAGWKFCRHCGAAVQKEKG
jgi:Zn-dependent protease with chaperone function